MNPQNKIKTILSGNHSTNLQSDGPRRYSIKKTAKNACTIIQIHQIGSNQDTFELNHEGIWSNNIDSSRYLFESNLTKYLD